MKKTDISDKVMGKVVRFERRRAWRSIGMFLTVLTIGLAIFAGSLYILARALFNEEIASLLDLYLQDQEFLRFLWRDIVWFVWEALPQGVVYFAGFTLLAIAVFLLITRHKRRVVWRRLRDIRQREPRT